MEATVLSVSPFPASGRLPVWERKCMVTTMSMASIRNNSKFASLLFPAAIAASFLPLSPPADFFKPNVYLSLAICPFSTR